MNKQTFIWNTALRISEFVGVPAEEIDVQIETDSRDTWEPVITYTDPDAGTIVAKWHDGESINDLRWQHA